MRSNDEAIANNTANYSPDEMCQCDCCGVVLPREKIYFVRRESWNNAPCDTYACADCCGREDDEQ